MKKVTLLDFRLQTEKVLNQVQKGQGFILTRRGKPVARLEPIAPTKPDAADPFYQLSGLGEGKSLTNLEIDNLLYGN